jgi:hypothetical protein
MGVLSESSSLEVVIARETACLAYHGDEGVENREERMAMSIWQPFGVREWMLEDE